MEKDFNQELNSQIEELNASNAVLPQTTFTPQQAGFSQSITNHRTPTNAQQKKKKIPAWVIIVSCLSVVFFNIPMIFLLHFLLSPNKSPENTSIISPLSSLQATLPTLQATQKATQMKSDTYDVFKAIQKYRDENNGEIPTIDQLNSGVIGNFESVDDGYYLFVEGKGRGDVSGEVEEKKDGKQAIWIFKKALCPNGEEIESSENDGDFSVVKKTNQDRIYCVGY